MDKSKRWNRLRSILKWVLWVLLFQLILINISASLHAWKLTHFYTDPDLRVARPSSQNILIKTWKLFAGVKIPRSQPAPEPTYSIDTVQLKTSGGITIDCWYARPDSVARGTIILFHGLTGNKNTCADEAADFRYRGYNLLLVDMRGHGSSSGNATTIGFGESEEVKLAFEYIRQRGEKHIFLSGISMGAVAIAKAISDYGITPAGVILEMPFASLQFHVEARSRAFGFPEEPFGFLVTGWIGVERGFNGYQFRTTEYVKKMDCPVLVLWGARDRYVKKEEIDEIYKNIPGNKKRLVVFEEAGHSSLLEADENKWRLETGHFMDTLSYVHPR